MKKKQVEAVGDLLNLLNSWFGAAAVALFLGALWVPGLYNAGLPHEVGTGVVQPTSPESDLVVLLEDGTYSTAVNLAADPGETVTLYDSDLGTFSGYGGKWEAIIVTALLGSAGVGATAALAALLCSSFLKRTERRVRQRSSA